MRMSDAIWIAMARGIVIVTAILRVFRAKSIARRIRGFGQQSVGGRTSRRARRRRQPFRAIHATTIRDRPSARQRRSTRSRGRWLIPETI
jgi:hypothetical protein